MSLDLQLNKLCHICESFATYNAQDLHNFEPFDFHNINGLIQSAEEGCHVCNLMVAELLENQIRGLQRELEDNPQHGTQQLRIDYCCGDVVLSHYFPGGYLRRKNLVQIHISDLRGRGVGPPTRNTGSPRISQMIRWWIEDCVCNHLEYCAIHKNRTSRPPTRLLCIQKSRTTFRVKLCLGSNSSLSTSYATLSHVWGSGSPIKLLSKNLLQFKQGIPFVRLPPTFADAVQLTDALGLSYLWIDSLCIIQDDPLDWEAESTAMCDVYRGSTINIAASASLDCQGGLFRQRNLLSFTPCVLPTISGDHALVCVNSKTGPVAREPLSGRAWAVQERLLAPRTVHFTTNSVHFECHSGTVSDIVRLDHYGAPMVHHDEGNNWAADNYLVDSGGGLSEKFLLERWKRVVTIYTEAQLTHESDKLIAIAGLAKFFQDLWPDPNITYLAGLWSFNLRFWLLWRTTSSTRHGEKLKTSCAPSWSWASAKGPIEWPERSRYASATRIIEARTIPPNNPFGSVQGGYIRIRGRMCTTKGNKEIVAFLTYNDLWLDDGDQGANRMEDVEGLFLLLAVKGDHFRVTEALVLEYAGDQIGQYRRVGYFSAKGEGAGQKLMSFFFEPPRLAKHLYLEVNEDNEYTIDII